MPQRSTFELCLSVGAAHHMLVLGPVGVHVSWFVVHWGPASCSFHRATILSFSSTVPMSRQLRTLAGTGVEWSLSMAVMERRLAASINIHSRTSTMYYWKGEIQDASEILMLVKTKTSKIQQVVDYVRSVHPYANPEVLSFPVEDGSLAYMKWMDEAIPDD